MTTDLETQRSAGDVCVGEDERVVDKVKVGETGDSSLMVNILAGRGEEDKMREGETGDSSFFKNTPAGRGRSSGRGEEEYNMGEGEEGNSCSLLGSIPAVLRYSSKLKCSR